MEKDPKKIEEMINEQRNFFSQIESIKYIDFAKCKTAEEIKLSSSTFSDDIRYAAIEACKAMGIEAFNYIPRLHEKNINMLYHEYVQALFVDQAFKNIIGDDELYKYLL